MWRGDASNFVRVLTRLIGSGSILVFLHDSVGVMSRPTSSGATLEMRLKL